MKSALKNKKSEKRRRFSRVLGDTSTYICIIRLLTRYNVGWLVIGITALMEGVFPFITIYMSSMLLDALYQNRSIAEMIAWSLAGAGVSLLISSLKHFSIRQKNIMWWGMQHRMATPLMKKTMGMDFELTENGRVRAIRARQDECRKRERDIFERFLEQFEVILTACVKLAVSLVTVWTFLIDCLTGKHDIDVIFFNVLFIVILVFCLVMIYKFVRKHGEIRVAISKEHEDENRLNDYMMSEVVLSTDAGKDIRIFHQQDMMSLYGEQMNKNWRRMTLQYASNDAKHFGLQGMLSTCVGGIVYLYMALCAYGGTSVLEML